MDFLFFLVFLNLNLQKSSLRDTVLTVSPVGLVWDYMTLVACPATSRSPLSSLEKNELHCSLLSQQGAVWQHQGVILFVTSQSAVEIVLK